MARLIGLDESGKFTRKSGFSFVGGYIADFESIELEEENIRTLLISICDKYNEEYLKKEKKKYRVLYPQSLHCNKEGTNFYIPNDISIGNSSQIKGTLVDPKVIKTDEDKERFPNFLMQNVMDYLKAKPYKFYAFLDPYIKNNTGNKIENNKSNLMDIECGENLYERMAIISMYNNVFYSLSNKSKKYILKFATRSLPNDSEEYKELYHTYLGKSEKDDKEPKVWANITNTSTYKTAMSTLFYEKEDNGKYLDCEFVFDVESINYINENKDDTPFHYIADVVCSYIANKLHEKFSIGEKVKENKITSEGLLEISNETGIEFRIYDECDVLYRDMINAVEMVDIVEYYAKYYELINSGYKYKELYITEWVLKLESYLKQNMETSIEYQNLFLGKIPEFISEMNGYMGIREKEYEKGLFIAENIVSTVEKLSNIRNRNAYLFEIYDIILRGYNHRGSIQKTKECVEKCEIYKGYVGLDTYVAHTLRTIEFYFNNLDFENALDAGLKLDVAVKELKRAYMLCYNTSGQISNGIIENGNDAQNYQYVLAGKLWSNIGQAYGFLKKFSSGQRYFTKALKEYDKNSANYVITLTHFMHLFISHEKREPYEQYADTYYKTSDLLKQLDDVFEDFNVFKLYVYVKAFNVFYAKDRSNVDILKKLLNRINCVAHDGQHPWELIYKNLYECILKQKSEFNIAEYQYIRENALTCIKYADTTIKMIQINAKLTFMQLEGEDVENYFAVDCLDEGEINTCSMFFENVSELTYEEIKNLLDEKMVYEYR